MAGFATERGVPVALVSSGFGLIPHGSGSRDGVWYGDRCGFGTVRDSPWGVAAPVPAVGIAYAVAQSISRVYLRYPGFYSTKIDVGGPQNAEPGGSLEVSTVASTPMRGLPLAGVGPLPALGNQVDGIPRLGRYGKEVGEGPAIEPEQGGRSP